MIERFIARPISSVSRVPDAPTSAPATIRTFSCSAKPGGRRGEARARVQERDHDGHVGAADREHEEDAERERGEDHADEQPLRLGPVRMTTASTSATAITSAFTTFCPG